MHVSGLRDTFLDFTPISEGSRPVKGGKGIVLYADGRGSIKLPMWCQTNPVKSPLFAMFSTFQEVSTSFFKEF